MKVLRSFSLLVLAVGLLLYPLLAVAGLLGYVLASRPLRTWPWTTPSLAVGAAALLSAVPSAWKLDALAGAGVVILLGVALYLLFTRFSISDARWLALGLGVALVAKAGLAAVQASNGGQATGFSYHPNMAAGLFIAGGFTLLGALLASRREASIIPWHLKLLLLVALVASIAGLALTGSRSGVLGFAAGAVTFMLLALIRLRLSARKWPVIISLLGLVAVAGWVGTGLWRSPETTNLLVNSGFEEGAYPWKLAEGSTRTTIGDPSNASEGAAPPEGIAPADGRWAILLDHDQPSWQVLLEHAEPIAAEEGLPYVVSLFVLPMGDTVAGTFLRVEARDQRGAFLARAGREGWTTGDEGRAGGRWHLPTGPGDAALVSEGQWMRFIAELPPTPPGTAELKLMIASDSQQTGTYGWVDALQVEMGVASTPYAAGSSAGIRAYLGPLVPRLLALRDPLSASGGRISMWHFSLELAAARPLLGYGFGVVEHLVRPEAPRYVADPLPHPHSFYLQLLLEGGTLMLVAVLMWMGLVAAWLFRQAAQGSWWAGAALAALVALLVQSVFDPVLAEGEVIGLWWVMCCGVVAQDGYTEPKTR